jgi:hypothetical protein
MNTLRWQVSSYLQRPGNMRLPFSPLFLEKKKKSWGWFTVEGDSHWVCINTGSNRPRSKYETRIVCKIGSHFAVV